MECLIKNAMFFSKRYVLYVLAIAKVNALPPEIADHVVKLPTCCGEDVYAANPLVPKPS